MRNKLAVVLDLVEDSSKLKPLTNHRPIASLPFASRYRIIDFIFSSMYNAEMGSAALFIAGSGHSLYDHIRSGSVWGLDASVGGGVFTHSQINYKLDQGENASYDYYNSHRKYINKSSAVKVLFTGSQVLMSANFDALVQYHREKTSLVTAVFKSIDPSELPEDTNIQKLTFDASVSGKVSEISEITKEDRQNNERLTVGTKMIVINKELALDFIDFAEKNSLQINADNAIRYSLENDIDVSGFEYTGYMKSLEDIKSYYQASLEILEEPAFNSLFYRNSPIITRSHHSAPTYYGKDSYVQHSEIASGSVFLGRVQNSIIHRNVFVAESAEIVNSIIFQNTTIGENTYLENVILDKEVIIEDNVVLKGTIDEPIVIEKGTVVTSDVQMSR